MWWGQKKLYEWIKIEDWNPHNTVFFKKDWTRKDYLANSICDPAISKKLKEIFEEEWIMKDWENVQFLPIRLEQLWNPDFVIEWEYFVVNILNILEWVIDENKSMKAPFWYADVVFNKQIKENNKHIFRVKEWHIPFYISEEVKKILDRKDLKIDLNFTNIEVSGENLEQYKENICEEKNIIQSCSEQHMVKYDWWFKSIFKRFLLFFKNNHSIQSGNNQKVYTAIQNYIPSQGFIRDEESQKYKQNTTIEIKSEDYEKYPYILYIAYNSTQSDYDYPVSMWTEYKIDQYDKEHYLTEIIPAENEEQKKEIQLFLEQKTKARIDMITKELNKDTFKSLYHNFQQETKNILDEDDDDFDRERDRYNWPANIKYFTHYIIEYYLCHDPVFKEKFDQEYNKQKQKYPDVSSEDIKKWIRDGTKDALKEILDIFPYFSQRTYRNFIYEINRFFLFPYTFFSYPKEKFKTQYQEMNDVLDEASNISNIMNWWEIYDQINYLTFTWACIGYQIIDPIWRKKSLYFFLTNE